MPRWLNADTGLGAAALVGSIVSTSFGYPTGLMGQAYLQNEGTLIAAFGAFGILSILMGGVIGAVMILRSKDRRLKRRLAAEKLNREEKRQQDEFERKLRRLQRKRR